MVEAVEREGGDITAADMVGKPNLPSKINEFYTGKTIFVTGATGFLGKLIVEKLFRTVRDVERIYVLMRPKKGKTVQERFEATFDNVVFDRLRREYPKFTEKVTIINGDCAEPNLGLKEDDKQTIIDTVSCIFHVAATVRFDEKMRTACAINVRATRDLLRMAKEAKNLKAFVYVSTAFSHCIRKDIDEVFYKSNISGEKLITLVDTLEDDMLDQITPTLIGEWPNTYAYTKAVAEDIVKCEAKGLPLVMVRPSIVISTVREPVAGWIDNLYGATGIFVGAAIGLVRTLHCYPDNKADMVPADFVVNCAIAAAWEIGSRSLDGNNEQSHKIEEQPIIKEETDPPIYNYVCSPQKPITWRGFNELGERYAKQIPSPLLVWHYCFFLNPSKFMHLLCIIFLHRIPAYIVDGVARCIGRQPMLVKGYQKIEKFLNVIAYFSTREWQFKNDNTQSLWKKLNVEDRSLYNFDMDSFDWQEFFYTYVRGGRVYLLKDPMDTLPQGKIKYLKLQIAHYTLVTIAFLILLKIVLVLWNCIF